MNHQVIHGNALDVLQTLPSNSVHMVLCSPPYWGLRDYGNTKQIGLEGSLQDWLARLLLVFAEVRRVLRADGTMWINMGDAFVTTANGGVGWNAGVNGMDRVLNMGTASRQCRRNRGTTSGLQLKDMIGQPWRLAFALQDSGWILRRDVIWSKGNPMPETAGDRPHTAHEYLFMFAKSQRYFYDADAVREVAAGKSKYGVSHAHDARIRDGARLGRSPGWRARQNASFSAAVKDIVHTRHCRSVWQINPQPSRLVQIAHQVRVELDAVDGDTKRKASADCPVHGDHVGQVSNASGDGREGASSHRTSRKRSCRVSALQPDSVPTVPRRGQRSAAYSSGSLAQPCVSVATPHSNGSRKKVHVPVTTSPCTPSAGTGSGIGHTSTSPSSVDQRRGKRVSKSVKVDSAGPLSAHKAAGNAGTFSSPDASCTCEYYKDVVEDHSHFATYPEELCRRPILACCPLRVCAYCGAPWTGVVCGVCRSQLTDAADVVPGTVLDPFCGSGTTNVVAMKHGRNAIGIELNQNTVRMARRRIAKTAAELTATQQPVDLDPR